MNLRFASDQSVVERCEAGLQRMASDDREVPLDALSINCDATASHRGHVTGEEDVDEA